jgi:hypothetical protein
VSPFRPFLQQQLRVYSRASSGSALEWVLSRTNLTDLCLHPTLTLDRSMPCSLFKSLGSLFATPVLCFQQLAASFRKIPGRGGSRSDFWTLGGSRRTLPLPETNLRNTRATSATASRPPRLFTLVREGCVITSLRLCFSVSPFPLRSCISFRMHTCKSVSKQTTLTPFTTNTCEKPRGGGTSHEGPPPFPHPLCALCVSVANPIPNPQVFDLPFARRIDWTFRHA